MNIFNSYPNDEPQNYTAKDKQLICHHCSNDSFFMQVAVLQWAGDFVYKKAICLTCS